MMQQLDVPTPKCHRINLIYECHLLTALLQDCLIVADQTLMEL